MGPVELSALARLPWAAGFETLDVRGDDRRTVVRLARPAQRNAINAAMIDELHAVCGELERRPRLLVLTGGEDGDFAAGADIAELRERMRDEALAGINLRLFERVRALPLPTLAAIDGPALGGGAELAYACDLRIATARSSFGQPEVRLGIMAAAGGCFRLAELIGEARAKELLFTGRRISAQEALAIGLVSRVVEPSALAATAAELCDEMAKAPATALRITKLAVDAPRGAHPAVDLVGQAVLFETDEKRERMDAFLARRGAR
jgi:enoyl-CoA hydratase/carnithine racemase